jgi:hypothetical protein
MRIPMRRVGRGGRRLALGGDPIRIPWRLAELLGAVAIFPLSALLALTVAAGSIHPSAQAHRPPASPGHTVLGVRIVPLVDPLIVGAAGSGPPPLSTLAAAPQLSTLEETTDGTLIPYQKYSATQVEAIITAAAEAHGVDPAWMIRTAECESTLRPDAYNPSGPYYGLFQFLMSTFHAHGGTDIWDPVQQSDITASMFASGDSSAWPVCSHA